MINTVAIHGYRSLRELVLPLGPVTLVTGGNGAGKTSLYRALGLLASCATGQLARDLVSEGGLGAVLWAGPETISAAMRRGEVPVQGKGRRVKPVSLMLGVTTDDLGYLVDIGLPAPRTTMFVHDPEVKREAVFAGPVMRPASMLVRRKNAQVHVRDEGWQQVLDGLPPQLSMLSELADPAAYPDLMAVRHELRNWRFYDSFRTDRAAPARQPQVNTWTPVLAPDGGDVAAALQTILESAFAEPLVEAVAKAFPGGELVVADRDPRMELQLHQHGLLRPMGADELSDGTLRFLLLAAALLSPRPPRLLVLNEPEASLHPDLLPAVAGLVAAASQRTQVLVVSHSSLLAEALAASLGDELVHQDLVKDTGETMVAGRGMFDQPLWDWGSR